ncbi:MAG: gliding motility-associated C-terminal domain-containing protein [Bacteroidota bacterium]
MKTIKHLLFLLFLLCCHTLLIAQRGKSGAFTVSTLNTIVNEYTNLAVDAPSGSSSINVGNSSLNSGGTFPSTLKAGDLFMILQMQGATIKSGVMDSTWGEVLNYNSCGSYEFCEVISVPNSTTITICPLQNSYSASGKTQIIRIPRYSSLTVNSGGSLICPPWNGSIGGVVSIEVLGNIIINSGGLIDVNGKGFRGGASEYSTKYYGGIQPASMDPLDGGERGEGIAGYQSDYDVYGGRYCRGAAGNAGGGGNAHNAGGGGGANGGNLSAWNGNGNPDTSNPSWITAWEMEYPGFSNSTSSGGGKGGYTWASEVDRDALIIAPGDTAWRGDYRRNVGGWGGRPLDYSQGRIFLGGGGGAGDQNNKCGSPGAEGGGMVYLRVYGDISGNGTITANGNNALSSTDRGIDGLGGGGGGGTIILNADGVVSGISAVANGGTGGNQITLKVESEGPGGGGGGGYIGISNGIISTSVSGANNGVSDCFSLVEFPPNGATKGGEGSTGMITNPAFDFIAFNDSVCTGSSANLTAQLFGTIPKGISILWFDEYGNIVGSGDAFTTPPLTTTTVYYVSVCPGTYRIPDTAFVSPEPVVNGTSKPGTCEGNDGSATITLGSGTFPFSYLWNNGSTTSTITGLTAGNYSVTVTDSKGCSKTASITVVQPFPITVTASATSAVCGASDGTATVSVSGGTAPYSYLWSNGYTTAAISGLTGGSYIVTVTDSKGCTKKSTAVVNSSAPPVAGISASVNIKCFGGNDGTISVSASGGTSPYTYSWNTSPVQNTATAVNLSAGTYQVTLTDINGCSSSLNVTITQPIPVTVTSTDATICTGSSATLTAFGSGGTGSINFTWSPGSLTGNTFTANPAATTTYTITAMDANNCIGTTTAQLTINPAPVINIPNATICKNSSVVLTASGSGIYTWSPSTGLNSLIGESVTASPTSATTYTVTGTNSFGCTGSTTVIVTVHPEIILLTTPAGICPGDTATLTVSGAINYIWSPVSGLNFAIGSTVKASPLTTTVYTITGTGNDGCIVNSTVTVTVFPEPTADFTVSSNSVTEFDPVFYFYDRSTDAVSWDWNFGDPDNSGSSIQHPFFAYPAVCANYKIRLAVANQYGCEDTTYGAVDVIGDFTFYVPNTITPNEDGINDGFTPKGTGVDESNYELWIFDRWGNFIWSTETWGEQWDGRANEGENVAQIDTYVWKVFVREKCSGIEHKYIGHVNIVK